MFAESLKGHAFFLLLALVHLFPRAAQALSKGDNCIAAYDYGAQCASPSIAYEYDDQVLANNIGETVYWENENGCWLWARIEFKNGQYGFTELPNSTVEQMVTNCDLYRNTRVSWCIGTCSSTTRRLLTDEKRVFSLGEESEVKKYQHHVETCGDYKYTASFAIVDTHFHTIASPSEEGRVAGCPSVVTGASFEAGGTKADSVAPPYRKDLWILDEEEHDEFIGSQESFHVGTFQLSELVRAHEGVDPNQSQIHAYDIIKLNCADYLLGLAAQLNVRIDSKMTAFVTRRLVEDSGHMLANKIRNSVYYFSLFRGEKNDGVGEHRHRRRLGQEHHHHGGREEQITDKEVIEALVATRAMA